MCAFAENIKIKNNNTEIYSREDGDIIQKTTDILLKRGENTEEEKQK